VFSIHSYPLASYIFELLRITVANHQVYFGSQNRGEGGRGALCKEIRSAIDHL